MSAEARDTVTNGLVTVTGNAGFSFKGFTFSAFDPPPHLTRDRKSISVAGSKWYSKEDLLSLSIPDLNFAKKRRGKKQFQFQRTFYRTLSLAQIVLVG